MSSQKPPTCTPIGMLDSRIEFQAAQGLELAQSFAKARGLDAVPSGSPGHRFWTAAASMSMRSGLGDSADTLNRAACDGVTPSEAGAKHAGLRRVAAACDALAAARRKPTRGKDALATSEVLLQTGQIHGPIVDSPEWEAYAPIGDEPTFGMMQYQTVRVEANGRAEPSSDMSGDKGNVVTLGISKRQSNVAYFQVKSPGFDPLQRAQASAQGIDPIGEADRTAQQVIHDSVAQYILYSDSAFNWQGLLDTDTPTQITATPMSSVTCAALVEGIASTLQAAFSTAAGNRFKPNAIAIAQTVWISMVRLIDSGSGRTGQQVLRDTFPGVDIRGLTHLDSLANFDGGTKHGVIMAQAGPSGLYTVMSRAPFVFTWEEGGRVVTHYVSGFAGTHFPHKAAFIVGDQAT